MTSSAARLAASTSLVMLLVLCLAWELWLAPLRPGGSWLALKVLPLLWIMPGIIRGHIYTYRASTMLILVYFAEGVVRAYSDRGPGANLALIEVALCSIFFAAVIAYVRSARAARSATSGTAA